MDELDKHISNIVSKKVNEPPKYEYTIRNALKSSRKFSKINDIIRKIAIIIISSIVTVGGVVFAKQLYKNINEMINIQEGYIVENNEYIQNLNMEYKTIDNLSIRINSILVDDFQIQLGIEYLYTNSITSAESKIIIKDENNNLIFKNENFDYFENIFKIENRHKYRDNENVDNNEQIYQSQFTKRYQSCYKNITNNNIKRTIDLFTDMDLEKFPESKKIYIQLEDITLKDNSNVVKKIDKKWNFEIGLNEKFLNRKTSIYTLENINYNSQDFIAIQAEASNVQFNLKIKYSGEQDLRQLIDASNLESIQVFDSIKNQYINAQTIEITNNNILKVNFDIQRNTLSDTVIIKIKNANDIKIVKK